MGHSYLKCPEKSVHPHSAEATPYLDTTVFGGVALGADGVEWNDKGIYS